MPRSAAARWKGSNGSAAPGLPWWKIEQGSLLGALHDRFQRPAVGSVEPAHP